jgi:hypothetical protein
MPLIYAVSRYESMSAVARLLVYLEVYIGANYVTELTGIRNETL